MVMKSVAPRPAAVASHADGAKSNTATRALRTRRE
jgi:hypothetical protein